MPRRTERRTSPRHETEPATGLPRRIPSKLRGQARRLKGEM